MCRDCGCSLGPAATHSGGGARGEEVAAQRRLAHAGGLAGTILEADALGIDLAPHASVRQSEDPAAFADQRGALQRGFDRIDLDRALRAEQAGKGRHFEAEQLAARLGDSGAVDHNDVALTLGGVQRARGGVETGQPGCVVRDPAAGHQALERLGSFLGGRGLAKLPIGLFHGHIGDEALFVDGHACRRHINQVGEHEGAAVGEAHELLPRRPAERPLADDRGALVAG